MRCLQFLAIAIVLCKSMSWQIKSWLQGRRYHAGKMEFPVLLDMEAPEIYAYSIYSVIAEKFEAFVSLGLANGRYKDFYDIYVLADSYDLDGMLKEKQFFNDVFYK